MNNELRPLQGRITPLLREHGVSNAGVFGSRARADSGPGSDVNLLDQFESGRSLLDIDALKQDLSEMLCTETDVITCESIHPFLRERILADGVQIYDQT